MLKRGTQVSLFAAESERWATYLRIRRKKKECSVCQAQELLEGHLHMNQIYQKKTNEWQFWKGKKNRNPVERSEQRESSVAAMADVRIGSDRSLEKVLQKVCLFACLLESEAGHKLLNTAKGEFELLILLPPPLKCCDCRCANKHVQLRGAGDEIHDFHMFGERSIGELHLQLQEDSNPNLITWAC